jgi:hypothetical protein
MKIHSVFALTLHLSACGNRESAESAAPETNHKTDSNVHAVTQPAAYVDSALLAESALVLGALCNRDTAALSKAIAPGGKLLFAPYGYIDTASSRKFTGASLSKAFQEKKKINWGKYDGSGKPILLSPDENFRKFVCNGDFSKYDTIRANIPVARGNSLNNLSTVFPGCVFVEYYHKGTPEMSELDWHTLRLVYTMVDGKRYLVAVIHDQWTS